MKRHQVAAVVLSGVMAVTSCMPAGLQAHAAQLDEAAVGITAQAPGEAELEPEEEAGEETGQESIGTDGELNEAGEESGDENSSDPERTGGEEGGQNSAAATEAEDAAAEEAGEEKEAEAGEADGTAQEDDEQPSYGGEVSDGSEASPEQEELAEGEVLPDSESKENETGDEKTAEEKAGDEKTGDEVPEAELTEEITDAAEGNTASGGAVPMIIPGDETEFAIVLKNGNRFNSGKATSYYTIYADPNETITFEAEPNADVFKDITYTWTEGYDGKVLQEGPNPSITVKAAKNKYYKCRAVTPDGAESIFDVELRIQNHLEAHPEGAKQDQNGKYSDWVAVYAASGKTVTLKAVVSADNKKGMTYIWYKNGYKESGTTSSLRVSVDENTRLDSYRCEVQDKYGNSVDLCFSIFNTDMIPLTAYPEGEKEGVSSATYKVSHGETIKLHTIAGSQNGGLRYSWKRSDGGYYTGRYETAVSGKTDTITIKADVTCWYICTVTDAKGEEESVTYYIDVKGPEVYPEGAQPESGGGHNPGVAINVEKGQKQTLRVIAEGADQDGLRYQWMDENNKVLKSGTDSFDILAQKDKATYHCLVLDKYNNEHMLSFYVKLVDDVRVTPVSSAASTPADLHNDTTIYAGNGQKVNLQAAASSENGSELKYSWIYCKAEERFDSDNGITYRAISDEKTDSMTVTVNGNQYYRCTVRTPDNKLYYAGFLILAESAPAGTKYAQNLTAETEANGTINAGGSTAIRTTTLNKAAKITYEALDKEIAAVSTTGTVTGKKPGIARICVKASAGGKYAADERIITVKVLPAATSALTLTNQAASVKLTWKAVPGANGYYIYRNGAKMATISNGTTTAYTDAKASKSGKYVYKIVAKAPVGTSKLSKQATTYQLARRTISSVDSKASGSATVKWNSDAYSGGYELQYSVKSDFSDARIIRISGGSRTDRTIGKLRKGARYYFRIRSVKTVSGKKYYSAWSKARAVTVRK